MKKILNIAKYLLFAVIGIFLFWKVYKDQPIDELLEAAKEINYWWILLTLVIGIFSHIARALRWEIALQSNDISARKDNLFYSVMVGYLANYALPRMGEITRAAVLKKYNGVSFTKGFGTIVTERIVDLIILLIFTFFIFIFQRDVITKFLLENPSVSENVKKIFSLNNILIVSISLTVIILAYFFFITKIKPNSKILGKIKEKLTSFKVSVFSIFKLKRPLLYVLYSILIWVLYYLSFYFAFPAFKFFDEIEIGHLIAFTVYVMASYGMVAPVQGGIGAYHFMVISTLIIYGVGTTDARLFALVVHGSQTILIIVTGFLSLIAMSFINKKIKNYGKTKIY